MIVVVAGRCNRMSEASLERHTEQSIRGSVANEHSGGLQTCII